MTASPPISHSTRFVTLEQADFQRLEHAGYLTIMVAGTTPEDERDFGVEGNE